MVYKVTLSDRSIGDLKGICEYIAKDNPHAARKLGHDLLNQIQSLSELPRRGRIYDQSNHNTVYESLARGYRAFYQINETSKQVEVLHIRHAARSEPILGNL
jgi:toxin ParE1/3/4